MKHRRFQTMVCLCVALSLALAALPAFAAVDYTLMEKVQKQLAVGSGIQGTLTAQLTRAAEDGAPVAADPVEIAVSYIAPRLGTQPELTSRTELTASGVSLAVSEEYGKAYARLDALGGDWYAVAGGLSGAALRALRGFAGDLPLMEVYGVAAPFVFSSGDSLTDAFAGVSGPFEAALGALMMTHQTVSTLEKNESGTRVIHMQCEIPVSALKTSLKETVSQMLTDEAFLALMREKLGAEDFSTMMSRGLESYYHQSIDALPLAGTLFIRQLSTVAGETLATEFTAPLYDEKSGECTFTLVKQAADGEDADSYAITLETKRGTYTLHYLLSEAADTGMTCTGDFAVTPAANAEAPLAPVAVDFSLQRIRKDSVDAEGRDVTSFTYFIGTTPPLNQPVLPDDAPEAAKLLQSPFSASLFLSFSSILAPQASVAVKAELSASYGAAPESLALSFDGKTVAPWQASAVAPEDAVDADALSDAESAALHTRFWNAVAAVLSGEKVEPEATVEPTTPDAPEATVEPTTPDAPEATTDPTTDPTAPETPADPTTPDATDPTAPETPDAPFPELDADTDEPPVG